MPRDGDRVATQGCVKESIMSLLDLGIGVSIVVDAVGPDIYEEPAAGHRGTRASASLP